MIHHIGRIFYFVLALIVIVAGLAHSLVNSVVEWSNHLIALDKSPGIRPIGVGESLR